jgi:hypothetical protein
LLGVEITTLDIHKIMEADELRPETRKAQEEEKERVKKLEELKKRKEREERRKQKEEPETPSHVVVINPARPDTEPEVRLQSNLAKHAKPHQVS